MTTTRTVVACIALALSLPAVAFGRASRYDNMALSSVTRKGIPNATGTVCNATSGGSPCNPPATPNPFTTDSFGNYGLSAPQGRHVLTITGATPAAAASFNITIPPSADNTALKGAGTDPVQLQYVSSSGSDSNDGLSPGTAKATISAADTALGASPGQILVVSSLTLSAASTLSSGHELICLGSQDVITLANLSASITQQSNTRIEDCTFSSAQTGTITGNPGGSEIWSQGTSNVEAGNMTFIGGGAHINYNNVSNFSIKNSRVVSLTTPGPSILIYQSGPGQITSPRVDGFTWPSDTNERSTIFVSSSHDVEVADPSIRNVDGSQVVNFSGIAFSTSTHCSLVGGVITGLKNGDGVVTEAGSTDITISGTQSYGNGAPGGVGAYTNNGDGFDIYNAARVQLTNCIARSNGATISPNIDVFESADVTITGCDTSDDLGEPGIFVVGSPRTKLIGVTSNRNYWSGASFTPALGTLNTSGTSVTWVSGQTFGAVWDPNTPISINGVTYLIASVQSSTALTLQTSAGTQSGVGYSVDCIDVQIIGGEYSGNGLIGGGLPGKSEGLYFGGGTTAQVYGVLATDPKTLPTQTYGVRLENTARAVFTGNNFRGNSTGDIKDSVGRSPVLNDDGSNNLLNATRLGTNFLFSVREQTQSACAAGYDNVIGNQVTHTLQACYNNGPVSTIPLVGLTQSWSADQTNSARWIGKRFFANQGTALTSGNFALGGNWGIGPSVSAVNGYDQAAAVNITAGGGSPGANPTISLTFADGTWTNAPNCVGGRGDTNAPITATWTTSSQTATAVTFNFIGRPVARTVYTLIFTCMGR